MATFYQTRYAVSDGIITVEGTLASTDPTYVCHGQYGFDKLGKDIFATREEALVDAKTRLEKSIRSTEKKLRKLETKLANLSK